MSYNMSLYMSYICFLFFLFPVELWSDRVTTPKYLGNHCRITTETVSESFGNPPPVFHQAARNLATSPKYTSKIQWKYV